MQLTIDDPEMIRETAYLIWLDRGRPKGTELEDWLEAERLLTQPNRRYGLRELRRRYGLREI